MARIGQFIGLLREYLTGLQLSLDPVQLVASADQRVASIGWIERGGQVLMLERRQEPFTGRWTAPGGKLELGETPPAALVREMGEETGWLIRDFRLRLITTETGTPGYEWVTFVFHCPVKGDRPVCRFRPEGIQEWVPFTEVPQRRIPAVDRLLLPYIFPGLRSPLPVREGGPAAMEPEEAQRLAALAETVGYEPDPNQIYLAQIEYDSLAQLRSVRVRAVGTSAQPACGA